MFLMELTLLVAIILMGKSDAGDMKGDWVLQMKTILAFIHPLLPDIFEISYLCLYIIAIILRDLIIMIFGVVVFISIALIVLK